MAKRIRFVGIETRRDGYSPLQCGGTMTVGELIEKLQEFNEDLPVYFNNDNGYTYGSFVEWGIEEDEYAEDEDDEDEDDESED